MREAPRHFWQRKAIKQASLKRCAHKDCSAVGQYRAPRPDGTSHLQNDRSWLWFCLVHVRDYNAAWSYGDNISDQEYDEHIKRDKVWERPSWPLGSWQSSVTSNPYTSNHSKMDTTNNTSLHDDPFGFFQRHEKKSSHRKQPLQDAQDIHSPAQQEAIHLFGLPTVFTHEELKAAYRVLVKRYHPDVNKIDPHNDETIKKINHSYKILCDGIK